MDMDYPRVIFQAPTVVQFLNHRVDCGTGHRPDKLEVYGLKAYSDLQFQILVATARQALLERRPTRVISGMALGWDLALAVAALDLGILLTCAIPYEGQATSWRKSPHMIALYHDILRRADRVVLVCSPGYSSEKMQKRNVYMVDNSDEVIALYNGDKFGGTYNCLRYAYGKKSVFNYWSVFVSLAREAAHAP
jgi:uncharacterized phage-like protein YoqJ